MFGLGDQTHGLSDEQVFCLRFDRILKEGAKKGFLYKFDHSNPECTTFWNRYFLLQWQQGDAFFQEKIRSDVFENWLRQRRLDWNYGFDRISSFANFFLNDDVRKRGSIVLDGIAAFEFFLEADTDTLVGLSSKILLEIEQLRKAEDASSFRYIYSKSMKTNDWASYSASQQDLWELEGVTLRACRAFVSHAMEFVVGYGQKEFTGPVLVEQELRKSLDRQTAYRTGWRIVEREAWQYMRGFILDMRSVMMSADDGRILQVLDRKKEG